MVCKCCAFQTLSKFKGSLSLFTPSLVAASSTCEKLEKARNDLQTAYEGFVQKLNQQHQTDRTELENRLKEFYTAECEKLQSIYIEEAEKYKTQLQEQVRAPLGCSGRGCLLEFRMLSTFLMSYPLPFCVNGGKLLGFL